MIHEYRDQSIPFPPPLGDLSTKRLVRLALMAQADGHLPVALRGRGASVNDVRRELVRRETAGAGVGR